MTDSEISKIRKLVWSTMQNEDRSAAKAHRKSLNKKMHRTKSFNKIEKPR